MSTVRAQPPSRTRARPNADNFVAWGAGDEKESVRTGKAFEPMPLGAGGQGVGTNDQRGQHRQRKAVHWDPLVISGQTLSESGRAACSAGMVSSIR